MIQISEPKTVVCFGKPESGKRKLLRRIFYGCFDNDPEMNYGIDLNCIKVLHKYELNIWNTPSDDKFISITQLYMKGALGVILVFDLTQQKTLDELINTWITYLKDSCKSNAYVMLVGNKCDLSDNRQVPYEKAKLIAKEHNFDYIEVSAKTGERIYDFLIALAYGVYEEKNEQDPPKKLFNFFGRKNNEIFLFFF